MSNPEDKKELEGLDPELNENEEASEGGNDALQNELEKIRALFQDELDHAKEVGVPESDEAAEDEEEDTAEIDEEAELCACCGENPRDTSVSENYEYCAECREAMRKYPISWKPVVILLVVIGCVLFATWDSIDTMPVFAKTLQAESAYKNKNVKQSVELYYNLSTTVDAGFTSKRVAKGQAEAYYKLGYFEDMITIVDSAYSENDLKMPWNKELNEIYIKAKNLSKTADEVGMVISAQGDKKGKDYPFDEVVKAFDKYSDIKKKPEEKAVIAYYKYFAAYVAEKPAAIQYKYLEEIRKADESMVWLYGVPTAQTLVSMGKYNEAVELCNKYGKEFRDDTDYYAVRADAYRRQEQYEKAFEQLNLGLKIDPQSTSCLRQKAIVYLLKGNFEEAQVAAGDAYVLKPNDYEISYTYALTCLANKDMEEYETVVSNLSEYDETMGQIVLDFKSGKLTIQQIFLEGKGDVI